MRGGIVVHGHSHNSPTYTSWRKMRERCLQPKCPDYPDYGGRGITISPRWSGGGRGVSFLAFLEDMGERPIGTTLDRFPNRDGNYEPGNCRWATPIQQSHNSRNPKLVTFNGETHSIQGWGFRLGGSSSLVHHRMKEQNMTIEEALTTPIVEHQRRYGK